MPILVLLILLSGVTGQLLPPPGDGDIRTVYWELRNESEVWLTLEPRNANGDRAPLLTFTHHFLGRQPAAPPTHIEVRAFAGMFWAPRAELWLMIDDQERIDLASQGRSFGLVSGTPSDYLSEQVRIATLRRVAAAGRVTGNALGFDFELTGSQRAAITAFLERVLGTRPLRRM